MKKLFILLFFIPLLQTAEAQSKFPAGVTESDIWAFRNGLIMVHDSMKFLIPIVFAGASDTLSTKAYARGLVTGGSSFKWNKSGSAQVTDSIRFIQGSGMTLTQSGNTLTFVASAGSPDSSIFVTTMHLIAESTAAQLYNTNRLALRLLITDTTGQATYRDNLLALKATLTAVLKNADSTAMQLWNTNRIALKLNISAAGSEAYADSNWRNSLLALKVPWKDSTSSAASIFLGYLAGKYNYANPNLLFINSLNRGSVLGDTTKSIIYGFQDGIVANQRLYLNANVSVAGTVNGFTMRQGSALSDTGKFVLTTATIDTTHTAAVSDVNGIAPISVAAAGKNHIVSITGIKSMFAADSATFLGSANLTTTSIGTLLSLKRTTDTAYSVIFPTKNIGNLQFTVASGVYYFFDAFIVYSTAAVTTGIKIKMSFPATTIFTAKLDIAGVATSAKGSDFEGFLTATTDSVTATTSAVINKQYPCHISGTIVPSAGGTVSFQFASSVAASAITIKQGSTVFVRSGY